MELFRNNFFVTFRLLQISILFSLASGQDIDELDIDTGYEDFAEEIPYSFNKSTITQFGDLNYNTFISSFNALDVGIQNTLEEQFRVYKRECFLQGKCRKFGKQRAAGTVLKIFQNFHIKFYKFLRYVKYSNNFL